MDARTNPAPMTSLSHKEARVIVIGMMLPVFMGSLDNTNLATALPTIGRDLGDPHILPWLITAYLLAATAVVPLYGKIADIYGAPVHAAHRHHHLHGWARWCARWRRTCSC